MWQLEFDAALLQVVQDAVDAAAIDDLDALGAGAQLDPALASLGPKALVLNIRQEAPLSLVVGVRNSIARPRALAGNYANS